MHNCYQCGTLTSCTARWPHACMSDVQWKSNGSNIMVHVMSRCTVTKARWLVSSCQSNVRLIITCCRPAQVALQARPSAQCPDAAVQLHLKTFPGAKRPCLQSIAGLWATRLERSPPDTCFRVPLSGFPLRGRTPVCAGTVARSQVSLTVNPRSVPLCGIWRLAVSSYFN